MKSWMLFLILSLLMVACGDSDSGSNAPTNPSADIAQLRVTVSEARVFEQPSRDATLLFTLIEGDQTAILAQTPPDDLGVAWYQIGRGEIFGWIAGSQVEVIGDLTDVRDVALQADVPTLSPETPRPTASPTSLSAALPDIVFGIVNVGQAAVFDEPDRDALSNTQLFEGEQVDVIGRLADDTFYLVGRESLVLGWMLAAQLTIDGELEKVPELSEVDENISDLVGEDVASIATSAPVATETPSPTHTPILPTHTPNPSITPTITPTLDGAATAQSAATATLLPTAANVAAEPTTVPEIQGGFPPPLTLTLPSGWQYAHILAPINSIYITADLPVSIYRGPLVGDIFGRVWIAWGYPNVTSPTGEINLYADAVQLLRGMILDADTCEIGLGEEQREYFVGEYEAIGTIFSAVNCEDTEDIAGFFATLEVGGGNFTFFVGVEPADATNEGLPQLQSILNTVIFEGLE